VTLTTVGYGDITPVTPWGQFISMVGISSELGFANESSFSRYIKDKTGLSPSQYRKSARGRLNRL